MSSEGLRQRHPPGSAKSDASIEPRPMLAKHHSHPGGPIKHGSFKQLLRMALLALYFFGTSICILITQLLGAPLYFFNKDYYYAWMAVTKQHFGIVITTVTQWWSPTLIRISGDKSVRGQLRKTEDGRLECDFPERLILIANHQIYTDWLYLWWIAYTSRMHGHIYIILKESLKWIPILGQGMMFYGFIFLSRKWQRDKPRFQHRLRKLNSRHGGPMSGTHSLDPMWLLIFPEGTNLSSNGRKNSRMWAEKIGVPDLQHQLLPRSTGLLYCLQELKDTVEWVYDCTVAYEGVPRGQYGQDIFTLSSTYFKGRPPKSVNMHWRRFRVSEVPLNDAKEFEIWVAERWKEKDDLLEQYITTGRFPADGCNGVEQNGSANGRAVKGAGWIETEVKLANPFEFLQIYVPVVALGLLVNVILNLQRLFLRIFLGA